MVEKKNNKNSEENLNKFCSPIIPDVQMCISYDESGCPIVEWKEINYKDLVTSNGTAEDWSLNNMLKAGINPQGSIHTAGAGSRLDNYSAIGEFTKVADELLNEGNNDNIN